MEIRPAFSKDLNFVSVKNVGVKDLNQSSSYSENTEVAEKPSVLKTALAFAITLLFLFIVFYVASRAWKKGQEAN